MIITHCSIGTIDLYIPNDNLNAIWYLYGITYVSTFHQVLYNKIDGKGVCLNASYKFEFDKKILSFKSIYVFG